MGEGDKERAAARAPTDRGSQPAGAGEGEAQEGPQGAAQLLRVAASGDQAGA